MSPVAATNDNVKPFALCIFSGSRLFCASSATTLIGSSKAHMFRACLVYGDGLVTFVYIVPGGVAFATAGCEFAAAMQSQLPVGNLGLPKEHPYDFL